MRIGLLKEPDHENRVSLLPETVQQLNKNGIEIWVDSGAGEKASAEDSAYLAAGAVVKDRSSVLKESEIILSIHLPFDYSEIPSGRWLVGVYQPLFSVSKMEELARQGLVIVSMDMLPRTSRAQSMDVLSSQANIAGYKAVLRAAELYPRYFPMLMTAAGSVPPAKVLVLGAGVAGLQAVATARRLGAVVEVFDTRPAVKEEVMSLGAKFIEVEGAADPSSAGGYAVEQSEEFRGKQRERIAEAVRKTDIVITTAQIPGKKAPLLVTEEMIRSMRAGSVIVDLAAATGGNTECTEDEKVVNVGGVTIAGFSTLPSAMPADASRLYGKNIFNFISLLKQKDGEHLLQADDELVKGCMITLNGEVIHPRVIELGANK